MADGDLSYRITSQPSGGVSDGTATPQRGRASARTKTGCADPPIDDKPKTGYAVPQSKGRSQ